jgi:hypothetical protein
MKGMNKLRSILARKQCDHLFNEGGLICLILTKDEGGFVIFLSPASRSEIHTVTECMIIQGGAALINESLRPIHCRFGESTVVCPAPSG